MEQLVSSIKYPQPLAIFVPQRIPLPNSCRNSMRRCRSGAETLRHFLLPHLQAPSATLATVILVIVEGLLVFLLLLLDVSIQDSLRILGCLNGTGNLTLAHGLASDIASDLKRPLECTSSILLTAFLLEVIIRSFVAGKRLVRYYWEILDAIITIIAFTINITLLVDFSIGKQVAQFIILFRLWRILELLSGASFTKTLDDDDGAFNDAHLESASGSASAISNSTNDTYVAEQSVTTLMLRIEELEQEVMLLRQRPKVVAAPSSAQKDKPTCQRCVNHNWTTDDLLKMACMQLSRSDSKFREDLRAAKSLEDLSLPESGYSSTEKKQRKLRPAYPSLFATAEDQTMDGRFFGGRPVPEEWLAELSEIKRISQIEFCPDFHQTDVPVTSL